MAKGGAGKGSRRKHKGVERASQNAAGAAALRQAGKAARRNQANQVRQHKRAAQLERYRAATGEAGAPKVVTLIAAGALADTAAVAQQLRAHATATSGASSFAVQRHRFTLLQPARTVGAVLDANKASDVLVLVIPAEGGLDALGEQLVDALAMQGVGTVAGVLQGVERLPQKVRAATRREWGKSLETRFPSATKLLSADLDPNSLLLLRHLQALTPKPLEWRRHASFVLAHAHELTTAPPLPDGTPSLASVAPLVPGGAAAPPEPEALLTVYGYVRGLPLSVDRAIHVPGIGDVLPVEIRRLPDPLKSARAGRGGGGGGGGGGAGGEEGEEAMAVEGASAAGDCISESAGASSSLPSEGEALVSSGTRMALTYEAEGEALGGEQTWPTDQELADAERAAADDEDDEDDAGGGTMADGQVDDDDGEDDEDEDEDAMDDEAGGGGRAAALAAGEDLLSDDGAADAAMDAAGREGEGALEGSARREWLQRRREARDGDLVFPDEVDTPLDVPAKTRFARYRGLKSWRTSTWHPKENLPPEYAKIYNFRNWAGFQAHALGEQAAAAEAHPRSVAPAGSYVAITLRVPRAFGDRYGAIGGVDAEGTATHAAPLVLCGVHTYEAHLSVRSRLGATDCD